MVVVVSSDVGSGSGIDTATWNSTLPRHVEDEIPYHHEHKKWCVGTISLHLGLCLQLCRIVIHSEYMRQRITTTSLSLKVVRGFLAGT